MVAILKYEKFLEIMNGSNANIRPVFLNAPKIFPTTF